MHKRIKYKLLKGVHCVKGLQVRACYITLPSVKTGRQVSPP
nr:MAG TPA: hypothetical protein [Caudoviricetes sp.]